MGAFAIVGISVHFLFFHDCDNDGMGGHNHGCNLVLSEKRRIRPRTRVCYLYCRMR